MRFLLGRVPLLLLLGACATAGGPASTAGPDADGGVFSRVLRRFRPAPPLNQVRPDGKFVLIDITTNELRFMDGDQMLWTAPVGTGTGLRMRSGDGEWDFATPTGVFQVGFKELDPTWIVPDWYFVERNLPVPPENSPKRRLKNELGVAAVYFGEGLAIHGTDKPELLGQRVSHGCIRLADEYALRLFHNVQVGTPVVIRGRQNRAAEQAAAPTAASAKPKPAPVRPDAGPPTSQLLAQLDRQIARASGSAAWTKTASVLIARGLANDSLALRGVLARAGRSDNQRFESEYATFLADAFSRGSQRVVVSLAKLEPQARARAARAIVQATMDLYHGPISEQAPWPTRRMPRWRLGPAGKLGWEALEQAERTLQAA